MTLRPWLIGGLILAAGARGAMAQGLTCGQDCSSGACLQSGCVTPAAGGGFCECSSGAVPLGDHAYGAYCRAWGQPHPGCRQALPLGQLANPAAPGTPQLPNASAMAAALFMQNPFVGVLVGAMQDAGGNWANAPVNGLIHDMYYDSDAGGLSQGTAVPFTAEATAPQPQSMAVGLFLRPRGPSLPELPRRRRARG